MAVCPEDAITITGRCLDPSHLLPLPALESRAQYDALYALMMARRSVRDFADREVPPEVVQRILDAASSAPAGIPPSDVSVLVFGGREKVRELFRASMREMRKWRSLPARAMFAVSAPFTSKQNRESMRTFVIPAIDMLVRSAGEGRDWLLYDAPLALYFHDNGYSDPADAHIAATYAMLAGEALGLGTCMLGFAPMLFRYGKALRRKYGVPDAMRNGLFVIFGYPAVGYRKTLKRSFASVTYAE
jgi:nitroreductase